MVSSKHCQTLYISLRETYRFGSSGRASRSPRCLPGRCPWTPGGGVA